MVHINNQAEGKDYSAQDVHKGQTTKTHIHTHTEVLLCVLTDDARGVVSCMHSDICRLFRIREVESAPLLARGGTDLDPGDWHHTHPYVCLWVCFELCVLSNVHSVGVGRVACWLSETGELVFVFMSKSLLWFCVALSRTSCSANKLLGTLFSGYSQWSTICSHLF